MTSKSLSDKLDAANPRPSGFDYLRLGLAIGVLAIHAPIVSYDDRGPIRPFHWPYLPAAPGGPDVLRA